MADPLTILLADDDISLRTVLTEALSREHYHVVPVSTAKDMLGALKRNRLAALVADVMFPDGNTLDLLPQIRAISPDLPIIMISAHSTLLTAIKAREEKVFSYLPKPFPLKEMLACLARATGRHETITIEKKPAEEHPPAIQAGASGPIVGKSLAMQEIYRAVARLVPTNLSVVIRGESGSGKEVVARAIHDLGFRREKPFVALNMAAIPRDLIESELFGYEKGAFTGADRRVEGRFAQAAGGTLFLDEIGDMPLDAQTRLLRVLQDGSFTRVGGGETVRVDTRIIAATHKDLRQQTTEGLFRQDLFFRLNVVPVSIPPLRERAGDIPDLLEYIMKKAEKEGLGVKVFSDNAIAAMQSYHWPGNVRELENFTRRILVLVDDKVITAKHIAQMLASDLQEEQGSQAEQKGPESNDTATAGINSLSLVVSQHIRRFFEAHNGALPRTGIYDMILEQIERPLIQETLVATGGNQLKAATVLGINRNTLRKKITALDIDPKPGRPRETSV